MENNLIVVKQLPIIEDQLRQVKASVDARVAQVLALACTEATYEDIDGVLVLADHNNLVGSETDAASRMRNIRSRKADALPESVTQGEQTANIVTPEIENRDRDKEIRDKSLDNLLYVNYHKLADRRKKEE